MAKKNIFVDEIYFFKGKWDIPSKCGLKIVDKKDKTIILVTEFYESNPGTSVTNWNTHLATELCLKFNINPENMIFIEHSPEMSSRFSFYKETFDLVSFDWDGSSFSNPRWKRISREEVFELINNS
ncbi:MAG: hypothetical protein JSV24_11790 [Bacteroidales bacterium]|nr:MAG: hypothetical protein JSV24_11790 [Bacteroidales bacterium]